ncbi:mechanosensitive ion channel family protein [Geminicoccus roseus]|uniref:mechanosensitive ion channel family protein n=1 Tax=Geminicoccus roseus TaxID=404900 RepID=UPI000421237C|nr:mechanosensitive ion channel family protein [Geminicoccus roseus]
MDELPPEVSLAWQKVDAMIAGFFRLLPNMVIGLVVLAVFVGLGWLASLLCRRFLTHRDRANLGQVLGGFVWWVVILLGVLVAMTIVFPSVKPADLLATLGIGSVAIGFAFKDILQNWLAGLLILFRQPFRPGDQIVVEGNEGTIERIETRATLIRTYDGRRAIIPNSVVYASAVTVNTAFPIRRSEYDVGIGYGDGIEAARDAILGAVTSLDGVERDPAPEVLAWDLAASAVILRVRYWTASERIDVVRQRGRVVEAVKNALDDAGIDMPFDTQVMLLHDQTEETDGMRGVQREGWPKAERPPRPRWQVTASGGQERALAGEPRQS